jgi:hypothetical protein
MNKQFLHRSLLIACGNDSLFLIPSWGYLGGPDALGSGITMKIVGLILLVVGAGLALWGYQLSDSIGSQLTQAVTGSEKVMTLYITGAASFIVGLYLFKS